MPESGSPKSALELALEKLDAQDEFAVQKLTGEQKEQIAEIRRKYQARIADQEISFQAKIRQALSEGELDKVDQLQSNLKSEKERSEEEMERAVQKVKQSGKGLSE